MRLGVALALTLGCVQPAWSLSCLQPDIARDFMFAAESDDSYLLVKGDLFFDEAALPQNDLSAERQPSDIEIPAWLDGYSLTRDGFTRRFERDVILRVECHGPWCGGITKGEYLAFLKREDTDFVISVSPCGGIAYKDPRPEQEATVTACMRGEPCISN